MKNINIIIPCFNEQNNIDKLINRYKCVYVNNNFIMDTIAGIFTLSVTGNYFYNLLK